jgi:hypothetical protein
VQPELVHRIAHRRRQRLVDLPRAHRLDRPPSTGSPSSPYPAVMLRASVIVSTGFCLTLLAAGCSAGEDPEVKTGLGDRNNATRQFTLPSKNIGCLVTAESARCDISDKQWKPPAQPDDCEQAWGNAVTVTAEGATLTCAGDTVTGADEILEYGKAVQVGEFVCTSASAGVRCTHAPSGHGFTLARASYTTF